MKDNLKFVHYRKQETHTILEYLRAVEALWCKVPDLLRFVDNLAVISKLLLCVPVCGRPYKRETTPNGREGRNLLYKRSTIWKLAKFLCPCPDRSLPLTIIRPFFCFHHVIIVDGTDVRSSYFRHNGHVVFRWYPWLEMCMEMRNT